MHGGHDWMSEGVAQTPQGCQLKSGPAFSIATYWASTSAGLSADAKGIVDPSTTNPIMIAIEHRMLVFMMIRKNWCNSSLNIDLSFWFA